MKKWAKRIGYGIGDLGCNLVFSTMASYLMVFYTDVFGITAAAAGTMMLVTKFIDALTDTGMGLIVDNTYKMGTGTSVFCDWCDPFCCVYGSDILRTRLWKYRKINLGICNLLSALYGIYSCKYSVEYDCAKADIGYS